MRLFLAILAGFATGAILSIGVDHILHVTGVYPPYNEPMHDNGLLLLAFIYRAVFDIGGAYVTAMIAKDKAMKAVIILGTVGSLFWLLGAIMMWDAAAAWYNIAGIVTGVPFCMLGGRLYQLRQQKKV